MKTSELAPRLVALEILARVLDQKRPLDESLEENSSLPGLEGRDRAFARNLVTTTLRRLGQIDQLIDTCLESPLPGRAFLSRNILRLGICQLVFLRTPPHAAVNTSVDLARQQKQGPWQKLINAILRRITREGDAMVEAQDASRLNTPDWLWDSWQDAYGEDTCRKIAASHLLEAPLDITCKTDPQGWTEKLEATVLPTGSLRLAKGGNVTELPGFDDGEWWVQDAAATLPVQMLGDVAGKRVIDICAAPGGKTAQLASMGAIVTAVDRSDKRLIRLRQNLERLNLKAEVITANATEWRPIELADAVLIDAPCSATGTIRRHPDLPYLKSATDVTKLANLQASLLNAAVQMVKPGGQIIYCTCSLQPEEGEQIIENALKAGLPISIQPTTLPEPMHSTAPDKDATGTRTLPPLFEDQGGCDNFFIASLVRD